MYTDGTESYDEIIQKRRNQNQSLKKKNKKKIHKEVQLDSDLTRKGKLISKRQLIKPVNVIKHSLVIQRKRGQFRKLSAVKYVGNHDFLF